MNRAVMVPLVFAVFAAALPGSPQTAPPAGDLPFTAAELEKLEAGEVVA